MTLFNSSISSKNGNFASFSLSIKKMNHSNYFAGLFMFIHLFSNWIRSDIYPSYICIIFHNALKQSELWWLFIMLPFHIHTIPIFIETIKIIDNVESFKIIEFHFEDFAWKLFSIILLFVFFQFRPNECI